MITVTTVILCFFLVVTPAPYAFGSHASSGCCTGYNRTPLPFRLIKGYREQTTMENCRIEAIIFYTAQKKMICATQKDEWVRKLLKLLSSKLKRMSKVNFKKRVKPNGSGSTIRTAEPFTSSTTGFYWP